MDAEIHVHHPHHAGHHEGGWVRSGGRRGRWLEPFLLLLVDEGEAHGYALIGQLNALGVAPAGVDVGMAYRTLRELEGDGLIASTWEADEGAPRRAYRLTPKGHEALADWVAVMRERARLIEAYVGRYERLGDAAGG